MSSSDLDSNSDTETRHASRPARAPHKARAQPSLKMQAIGYLSRREHSRQELRQKLLASLRQREREATARAAAAEAAARELAQALSEQPANGIDDAFAPPAVTANQGSGGRRCQGDANAGHPAASQPTPAKAASTTSPLASLRLASGAAIPARLRSELDSLVEQSARPVPEGVPPAWHEAEAEAAASLDQQDPEAVVDQLLDWLVANSYLSETRFVESRVNARSRKQGAMMIKYELQRHGLVLEPEQAAALRETEFARAHALWQRKFGEVAPDSRLRAKQARFLAARGFAADVVRRIVGGEEAS